MSAGALTAPTTPPAPAAPVWVRSSTAVPVSNPPPTAALPDTTLATAASPPPAAPEPVAVLDPPAAVPPPAAPTVGSPDGRLTLTATSLTVLGQTFGLRELERAEVQPVRWLLWYLLGALGLALVLILFLNNWLRTLPTMAGLLAAALLLLYGHRGTNRLRLWLLGRAPVHFALPGEAVGWQRLVHEVNRRVAQAHDQAAAETAAFLAALSAAQAEAEAAAQAAAEADAPAAISGPPT